MAENLQVLQASNYTMLRVAVPGLTMTARLLSVCQKQNAVIEAEVQNAKALA